MRRRQVLSACLQAGLWMAAVLPAWSQPQGYDADPYLEYLPPPPPRPLPWQRLELGAPDARYTLSMHASLALDTPGALQGVRRIVISIHDARRDARLAYEAVTALFAANRGRVDDTLVVAPRYAAPIDSGAAPAWRRDEWNNGEPSLGGAGRPAPVGAFRALDDLLHTLSDRARLPRLQAIVLAGHGAGAQMVQRYALLNQQDEALSRQGIALSYVIANADSYLYLNEDRPGGDDERFDKYERGICPTYTQYPYGLDKLPASLHVEPDADLAGRYAKRQVTYLLGSADNNPEQPGLDKRCGAEAQGATRLARGLGYWRYEAHLHGGAPPAHHAYVVQGIGHNTMAMYGSECGARALLGPDAGATPDAAGCQPPSP